MANQNIKEFKKWSADDVRAVCVNNDLYTCGTGEDYNHMLSWVERLYPDTENIHFIAEDICKHSKEQTVSNIMFLLANKAVTTFYEIEGEDEL